VVGGLIAGRVGGAATARGTIGRIFGLPAVFFRGITGAGRPLGSKNRPKFELPEQRETYAGADTPLKFLLAVMRDPLADWRRRDRAAKAAAPFIHAKPAAKATN
jgi:hypothetical protein